MKSSKEYLRRPPLKYPEGDEDQVTVSCCSYQRMRCREIGARTMYWHNASCVGWSRMLVPLSTVMRTDWQKR